jgi:hypothetical protein
MAKSRKPDESQAGSSVSGYFKAIYKENPDLLKSTSNQEIFDRWLKDHPEEKEVPDRVKYILSNVKSTLRKKLGGKRSRSRTEEQPTSAFQPVEVVLIRRVPLRGLEAVEESIDDCLSLAKRIDREGLEGVIALLRKARNGVIRMMVQ